MNFSNHYTVDTANKILICEIKGQISDALILEELIKTSVKIAGKNQIKNVVHDVTELNISCPNIEICKFLMKVHEHKWIADMKIARIVNTKLGNRSVLARLADRFDLPIKDFRSRSEAMLWLLFNKLPKSK